MTRSPTPTPDASWSWARSWAIRARRSATVTIRTVTRRWYDQTYNMMYNTDESAWRVTRGASFVRRAVARDHPFSAEGAPSRPPRRRPAARDDRRSREGPGLHRPPDDGPGRARALVPRERAIRIPPALPPRFRAHPRGHA